MSQAPERCPACKALNTHNLDYCSVCGKRFKKKVGRKSPVKDKRASSKERKIKAKRVKKRRELTDLYKKKKISTRQYAEGLKKLGYSTDIEKAMAFKKYIKEQIRAFEDMDIDNNAREGDSYYDPNEAMIDLPRDADGNVVVDFTVSKQRSSLNRKPTESMPIVDHDPSQENVQGPRFGESLFGDRGNRREKRVRDTVKKSTGPMIDKQSPGSRKRAGRRRRAMAEWDDEEEDEEMIQDDEEDFEIDLEVEEEGQSGWWDDDEWELEWTEEDEEEFGDLEIEFIDEEDEEGWVLEFDDDEDGSFDPEEDSDNGPNEDEQDDFEIELDDEDLGHDGFTVSFDDDE